MPVALVTGAARDRGIGGGIALALAERGFDVAIADREHEDEAARRVAEIEALGRRSVFVRGDVSRPDENERLVSEAAERLGRLDVFVANAGVARWQKLVEVTRDDWEHVFGVNLHGVLYGCRAAAARMRRQGDGGAIVVTSSVNAVMPFSPLGVYGASKHAVGLLVGVMAREWAGDGITVNHVGPAGSTPTSTTPRRTSRPRRAVRASARRYRWGTERPTHARSARRSPTWQLRPTRRERSSGWTAAS